MHRPRRSLHLIAVLLAAALSVGCASDNPDSSFDSVQSDVLQRTGVHVQWNRDSDADRAAEAAVAKLLAADLTAQSAVQIALLDNRDLQATYEDLGVAQADLVQAGLLRNPIFSADLEWADAGGGIKLQLSVMEDFLELVQIPMRRRITKANLAAATVAVEQAVIDLTGRVQEAVYRQQAAQAVVDLRASDKQAAEAALDLAERMHTAGNISDVELYERQARREEAELDLLAAQSAVADGREDLNILLGLDGEQTHWTISDKLPALPDTERDTTAIEKLATDASLELSAARSHIEQAAAQAGVAKTAAMIPDAEIGPSVEKESEHGPWETGAAVSFPIPLFDFGQAQRAKALAELRRQRQRYIAVAVRVRSEARRAAGELTTDRLRAASLGQVIAPLRRKISEELQLQYNGMLAGPFDLLQAKENQNEADARATEALRDYWLARLRVEQLFVGGSATHDGGS